jgi:hypothetical protein
MNARVHGTLLFALSLLLLSGCTWAESRATPLKYRPPTEGKLKTVKGVLEPNPAAEQPGLLMRTHYYTLGRYRVFTGGDRLPELEKRKGKEVALTGWVVDMELEGLSFREIRPVSVQTIR